MREQILNSAEGLQDAFQVFNELSQNLSRSYFELEAQVSRLTRELAAVRSERLQTLTEKAQLANRLQRLLEALPGGVLVTDEFGRIVEHNAAALHLLGIDLAGRSWRQVLETTTTPALDNPHQRLLQNGRTVSLCLSSLGDEPGQIILLTDISEMRTLQELVNQQKRLSVMGEMVASLAHQVRTPLSTALLYSAHLGRAELSKSQRERFSARLLERLQHMERQVNDMLTFARMGRLNLEQITVSGLIAKVVEMFEPTLEGKGIQLQVQNRFEQDNFFGNQDALLGVLLNLLNNAVEAIDGLTGRISLAVEHHAPDWLRIAVADDGPGMSADVLAHVFEPFFTTRPNGTGLGLAIVDCVVRAHGGRVDCQSVPGKGSCFRLDFPARVAPTFLHGGFSGHHHLREASHGTT